MKIETHPNFKKSYKKRIIPNTKLVQQTVSRLKLFQKNPKNPILKDHALVGDKANLRAFSITGDVRIVYLPVSVDHVILMDIGSYNQVY